MRSAGARPSERSSSRVEQGRDLCFKRIAGQLEQGTSWGQRGGRQASFPGSQGQGNPSPLQASYIPAAALCWPPLPHMGEMGWTQF